LSNDQTRYTKLNSDIDGDGDIDLILQSTDNFGWHSCVALNTCSNEVCSGENIFKEGKVQTLRSGVYGLFFDRFTKLAGDVNGDGNLDVMLQTADRWQILLAFGKGNGTFAPALKRTLMPGAFTTDYTAFSTCIGDVNADGRIDVVLQQNNSRGWLEHDALYNSDF